MSRDEKEKKEKRDRIVIGSVLIAILVFSTAGFAFFSVINLDKGEEREYNGIKFVVRGDGLWHFLINGQEFSTAYNPEQTKNISIEGEINLQNYYKKPLYFSHDSDEQGVSEIVRNIERYAERVQLACIEQCEENLPVKSCEDNVIIIKAGNETLIKQENNCIYILGEQNELIRAGDAFIFKLLGI